MDKEYLGITGLPTFTKVAAELAFGANSQVLAEKRVYKSNAILLAFVFEYIVYPTTVDLQYKV